MFIELFMIYYIIKQLNNNNNYYYIIYFVCCTILSLIVTIITDNITKQNHFKTITCETTIFYSAASCT